MLICFFVLFVLVPLSLSLSLSLNGGSWQAHEPPDRLWGANPLALSCDAAQAYQGARGWEALDHSQKAENKINKLRLKQKIKITFNRIEWRPKILKNKPKKQKQ